MEVVKTYRDEDCPSCGFPETLTVRNSETMEPIRLECSKQCGWEDEGNKAYKCLMCGYKSDMKHFKEWRGMCYQCYKGETEFKNEGMV